MATLTISDIDATAIQQLQADAAENGHSLEEEAREVLYASLGCQSDPEGSWGAAGKDTGATNGADAGLPPQVTGNGADTEPSSQVPGNGADAGLPSEAPENGMDAGLPAQEPGYEPSPYNDGGAEPISLAPEVIDKMIADTIAFCPEISEEDARDFEKEARELLHDVFEREPKPRHPMAVADRLFRRGDGISIDLILPLEGDEPSSPAY